FHEPLRRFAFNFEHHRPLQRAEPIVHQEKRNENSRDTDRHEPFITDVGWGMKCELFGPELIIELSNQRLEWRAFEPEAERRNSPLQELLLGQRHPIGYFHFANGITEKNAVTPPHGAALSKERQRPPLQELNG